MAGRGVFWFRRDLRAQDHPLLSLALRDCQELSFVYVLDPRELKPHPQLEIHRLGRFRRQFLLECLQDLQAALKQKGHKLYFFVSDPVEVFPALCQQYGFRHLYCSDFPASDETLQLQMVTNALKGQTQVHHLWHSTIIDQDRKSVV